MGGLPRGSGVLGDGAADHQRPCERGRLRHRGPLEARHPEPLGLDRGERWPVAIALNDKPVEPVHPVLEAGELWVVGAHVLQEEQLPAGSQHAMDLAQRARLVVDAAQHECGDDGVEGIVLERQILGRRAQHPSLRDVLAGVALEPADHRRSGFREDEGFNASVVEGEVRPGAGADLEHAPGGVGQQALP